MLFRATTEADLDRVTGFPIDDPVSSIDADRYLDELGQGMYRPEWTWIAEDDQRVVGRALWWGQASSEHPVALDCLHVEASVADRAAVAAGLPTAGLRAFAAQGAPKPPLYNLTLPNGWRDEPSVSAAVAWRRTAALAAGLTAEVERLRLEWTPAAGLPRPAAGSSSPRPPTRSSWTCSGGSRWAAGRRDRRNLAVKGPDATAREEMDFYLSCPGERAWWRLAYTTDGTLAGRRSVRDAVQTATSATWASSPSCADAAHIDDVPADDYPVPRRARGRPHHGHHRHDERADGRRPSRGRGTAPRKSGRSTRHRSS